MSINIIKKTKKDSKKKHVKDMKIFLKKKKAKGKNKPVNISSVNIIMNLIKIFLRNKNKD